MKINRFKISLIAILFIPLLSAFTATGFGPVYTAQISDKLLNSYSLTVRQNTQPWSVFFNVAPEEKKLSLFVDDWFISERLNSVFDYYVFWGLSLEFLRDDSLTEISAGSRGGAGLAVFMGRNVELFTQVSINPYYGLKIKDGKKSLFFRPLNFPCSAGLRFWLPLT